MHYAKITKLGNERQRQFRIVSWFGASRVVPLARELASGDATATIAITEPQAGSHVRGIRSRAFQDGEGRLVQASHAAS